MQYVILEVSLYVNFCRTPESTAVHNIYNLVCSIYLCLHNDMYIPHFMECYEPQRSMMEYDHLAHLNHISGTAVCFASSNQSTSC